MNKAVIFFSVLCYLSLLTACSNEADKQKMQAPSASADSVNFLKGLDVEPAIKATDSVQLLYYKDPYGDPERYTRFFTVLSTADTSLINPVLHNLDRIFFKQDKVRDCRSEGKMYLFNRQNEDPLQTIYFSTRCDSCCYLYYIKNGAFYYFSLDNNTKQVLSANKAKSKEPVVTK
ncbi:MAG: hypothetical protein SFU87_14420 [Chitinophagaceae bacterium]|nr:hypothetical protein [Chitinophagaceae bacterium]